MTIYDVIGQITDDINKDNSLIQQYTSTIQSMQTVENQQSQICNSLIHTEQFKKANTLDKQYIDLIDKLKDRVSDVRFDIRPLKQFIDWINNNYQYYRSDSND